LPNHACATAAAYDKYYVVESDGSVSGTWSRINGY
jgi:D-serine deaminase-like pyridoxal phosphate-dependent protein